MVGDCPIGHRRNFSRTDEVASQSVSHGTPVTTPGTRTRPDPEPDRGNKNKRAGRKEGSTTKGGRKTVVLPPPDPPGAPRSLDRAPFSHCNITNGTRGHGR